MLKALTVVIPKNLHQRLKVEAAERGVPMKTVLIEALNSYLS